MVWVPHIVYVCVCVCTSITSHCVWRACWSSVAHHQQSYITNVCVSVCVRAHCYACVRMYERINLRHVSSAIECACGFVWLCVYARMHASMCILSTNLSMCIYVCLCVGPCPCVFGANILAQSAHRLAVCDSVGLWKCVCVWICSSA